MDVPVLRMSSSQSTVYEDPEPTADERVDELERENDFLRSRLAALERQLNSRSSPTRKSKPRPAVMSNNDAGNNQNHLLSSDSSDLENMFQRVTAFKVAETYKSPVKPKAALVHGARNPRRVTSRKKDLGPEDNF